MTCVTISHSQTHSKRVHTADFAHLGNLANSTGMSFTRINKIKKNKEREREIQTHNKVQPQTCATFVVTNANF